MEKSDLNVLTKVAEKAADAARSVIRPYFRTPIAADVKSDDSPVTLADKQAEKAIRSVLEQTTPSFGIIGEEYGKDLRKTPWQWVIDPIDGTRAFITGRPIFGVLIALLYEGKPIIGIIDQPITQERWIGCKGQPSRFISLLGGKIGTRACAGLHQAEISCTAPEIMESAPHQRWKAIHKAAKRISWGGDCYAYGLLTLGQIDVIVECDLKLWDWAALVPIIEGAGGSITDWQGNPLTSESNGTVLASGDPLCQKEALNLLNHY